MSALATIALGALAEQAGVDVATIRAYERLGLIPKPIRVADIVWQPGQALALSKN